ncbi:MAG: Integral membrane protein [uncultured Friedmanniella sp.]|uniref:Integral membrane protein n=1 Tax=uncultured Friedmanniella sp. TaxID=335381 RepID=A0A6J4LQV8_9ACTN|nr:MAG: Integral membrane protein [uncultured Friedmanniella sp.]
MELSPARSVSTAPVVALGLLGGYLTARETGIRPLGGVVLAAAGAFAGRTWLAKRGPAVTAGLAAVYLLGFGASHPLAKKIGAWPSVLAVTAVSAGASYALVDRA